MHSHIGAFVIRCPNGGGFNPAMVTIPVSSLSTLSVEGYRGMCSSDFVFLLRLCFQYSKCLFIDTDGSPLQHIAGERKASCCFLIMLDQLVLPPHAKQFPLQAFSLLLCATKQMQENIKAVT